jgi:hypothetical protein
LHLYFLLIQIQNCNLCKFTFSKPSFKTKLQNQASNLTALLLLLWLSACQTPREPVQPDYPKSKSKHFSTKSAMPDLTDSIERPTVLGRKLPNPYTLVNMKKAYKNIRGGTWNSLTATHKYVRFRPSNTAQLVTLEDTQDLELSDEPLDYEILTEGDYYQDPAIPDEEITWQYAVVPANYSFPSGIPYELLASVHIPDDTQIEAEAERLVGLNEDGDLPASSSSLRKITPYIIVPTECPAGYCPDTSTPEPYSCVLCTNLPQPGTNPQGNILVRDTRLGDQGVRRTRVVARRWFKIERTFTDANGNFVINKRFRNKVKLLVKFKNSDAVIRRMCGIRFWQMFFPLKPKIGVFRNHEINTVSHTFRQTFGVSAKGNRFWVGATTHNAVQQFTELNAAQQAGSLPGRLKILISSLGFAGSGSAPLFAVRLREDLPEVFIRTYLLSNLSILGASINLLINALKSQVI